MQEKNDCWANFFFHEFWHKSYDQLKIFLDVIRTYFSDKKKDRETISEYRVS